MADDPDPNGPFTRNMEKLLTTFGCLSPPKEEPTAPKRPSSDELIEAVRYATREGQESRADRRRAWARFAAAGMFEIDTTEKAAEWADRMLVEYDKRFPQ